MGRGPASSGRAGGAACRGTGNTRCFAGCEPSVVSTRDGRGLAERNVRTASTLRPFCELRILISVRILARSCQWFRRISRCCQSWAVCAGCKHAKGSNLQSMRKADEGTPKWAKELLQNGRRTPYVKLAAPGTESVKGRPGYTVLCCTISLNSSS